jgi:hypothetical protein
MRLLFAELNATMARTNHAMLLAHTTASTPPMRSALVV